MFFPFIPLKPNRSIISFSVLLRDNKFACMCMREKIGKYPAASCGALIAPPAVALKGACTKKSSGSALFLAVATQCWCWRKLVTDSDRCLVTEYVTVQKQVNVVLQVQVKSRHLF